MTCTHGEAGPRGCRLCRRVYEARYTATHKAERKVQYENRAIARPMARLLHAAVVASRQRGHARPTITELDLANQWIAQAGRCVWTNVPMVLVRRNPWTVSIDRLDNAVGYTPANIVLTGWCINRFRNNLSVAEFRDVLDSILLADPERPR